jgi:uncharacterized membrane protein YhaH (DUF805 family)
MNRNAKIWELSASEFDAVIDVNVKGTANVIRHFLPLMKQGIIVNLSSGWGRRGNADVSLYVVSFSFFYLCQHCGLTTMLMKRLHGIHWSMFLFSYDSFYVMIPGPVVKIQMMAPTSLWLQLAITVKDLTSEDFAADCRLHHIVHQNLGSKGLQSLLPKKFRKV